MVYGGDFLILWMGETFQASIPILMLLTLPFFLTLPTLVFNYYLYAINKHKLNARILALEASTNIILSIILVQKFGLPGIALGTLIPAVIFRGLILPIQATKNTTVTLADYVHSSFTSCLPLAFAHFAVLYSLRNYIGAKTWLTFFLSNAVALSLFLLLVWIFYIGTEERSYLRRRFSARIS